MVKKREIKAIYTLGLPLLLGRLSHYFHQVTDSMMMGHYRDGSLELAALAMAGLLVWVFNTFLWPLGNGVQTVATRREGEEGRQRDPQWARIGMVLDNGIVVTLLVGSLAFVLSFTAPFWLSRLLKNEEVLALAITYIRIMRWSFIPFGLIMVLSRFAGAVKRARYVMISSTLSNLLNVVLNYLFIFGKGGFPQMGIAGAALGTLISQIVGLVYLLAVFLWDPYFKEYQLFQFKGLRISTMSNILRLAAPPMVQNIFAFVVMMLYESLVERVDPYYLAATHVAFSSFRINKTLVGGFGHAAAILVGNALGAGEKDKAVDIGRSSRIFAFSIGSLAFGVFFFFPHIVAQAFAGDSESIEVIARALRFFAPFYFLEILGFSYELIFNMNGWAPFTLKSEVATNLIFILGFSQLMAYFYNQNILLIWLGFGLYQLFHSLILHLGYWSRGWIEAKAE